MQIIPKKEWVRIFDELEGCGNFPAYVIELARFFENDARKSKDNVIFVQPLTKNQSDEQLKHLLEYFKDCPKDWEYASEKELIAEFGKCALLQPSPHAHVAIDVDFSIQNQLKKSKMESRTMALESRQDRDLADFKTEMTILGFQNERAQEKQQERLLTAMRRENPTLAHKAKKLF